MKHRNSTRVATAAAALILATGGVVGTSVTSALADAGSTPKATGCPEGYLTLSIAWLLEQFSGYRVPGMIDDPANGGNGDGIVCGNPVAPKQEEKFCGGPCPAPIYNFRDNSVTAH